MSSSSNDNNDCPEWLYKNWILPGHDLTTPLPDFGFRNAIYVAVVRGDVESFGFIEKTLGRDITGILSSQQESFVYLAAKSGQVAIVDYILRKTDNPKLIDYPQQQGKTPLWAAIFHSGSVDMVKLLILHGASLTAPAKNSDADFSPIGELGSKTLVAEFLQPLYEWLVKMKALNAKPPVSLAQEPIQFLDQDAMLHSLSFLDTRDCAGLQAVSPSLRQRVGHRLDNYSILLEALDKQHPLLKSGEMKDEVLSEDDDDYEVLTYWKQKRAESRQNGKEYARTHMNPEMFEIVYEL